MFVLSETFPPSIIVIPTSPLARAVPSKKAERTAFRTVGKVTRRKVVIGVADADARRALEVEERLRLEGFLHGPDHERKSRDEGGERHRRLRKDDAGSEGVVQDRPHGPVDPEKEEEKVTQGHRRKDERERRDEEDRTREARLRARRIECERHADHRKEHETRQGRLQRERNRKEQSIESTAPPSHSRDA